MQQKYRQVKLGLLIALLAFQSLSACLGTRQLLSHRDHKRSYNVSYRSESRLRHNLQKFGPLLILMLWTIGFPTWVILSHMKNKKSIFHRIPSDNSSVISPTAHPFSPSISNEGSSHSRGISMEDKINHYNQKLETGIHRFDQVDPRPFKQRHWKKLFKKQKPRRFKLPYHYD